MSPDLARIREESGGEFHDTLSTRMQEDGFVVIPALETSRVEALSRRLATLVKKNKSGPLRKDNFRGRRIAGESGRLQAIEGDFSGADESEWLDICSEFGEDVCAVLTALFGDSKTWYEVRQPATLFSVGTSNDLLVEREEGGTGHQCPHRDYPWATVQAAIAAKKYFRAFGCLVALERGTRLRVYPGSHERREEDIDPAAFVDVDIPLGSLCVFLDSLLHSGVGFVLSNLRQHMHLNAAYRKAIPQPGDLFSFARHPKFDTNHSRRSAGSRG